MADNKKDRPRHLGRGLASLLGPITLDDAETEQLLADPGDPKLPIDNDLRNSMIDIPLAEITANPFQSRTVWRDDLLADLADSIRANGVIQPVVLRRHGSGYQLIAGERRFRASKLAGLDHIPAVVRDVNDEQMHEWALVENIQRADLNPVERAQAYSRYIAAFSLTQAEAAERLGENRSVIANYLRLLDLPSEIKEMLSGGELSMGHARAILALPNDDLRRKLANRALAGRLSVREVERLVRLELTDSPETPAEPKAKPAYIVDLEQRLSSELATKVAIHTRRGGQKGRIIIEFYSLDEFESITQRIGIDAATEA